VIEAYFTEQMKTSILRTSQVI